jgi:hypothetical protein
MFTNRRFATVAVGTIIGFAALSATVPTIAMADYPWGEATTQNVAADYPWGEAADDYPWGEATDDYPWGKTGAAEAGDYPWG